MDIQELKKLTLNLDAYTAADVLELEVMTEEELSQYQYEIEHDTGNQSTWDAIRAIITLKKRFVDLEAEIKTVHSILESYQDKYYAEDVQKTVTWILEDSRKRLGIEE